MEFVPKSELDEVKCALDAAKSELDTAKREVQDYREFLICFYTLLDQKIDRIPKDTKKDISEALKGLVDDAYKFVAAMDNGGIDVE